MQKEESVAPRNSLEDVDAAGQLQRIANLLGLIVTKELPETERVATLSAAGFSNNEIATLLGKEPNNVRQALFKHKGKEKSKRRE